MLGTGVGGNAMTGTCGAGSLPALGVVLRIPCCGCFICPFAVAGLGLRYLFISLMLMYGDPLRNPPFSSFEKGGNLWVAQQLVPKFDIIDPCLNQV